jgi:hypothetical protein
MGQHHMHSRAGVSVGALIGLLLVTAPPGWAAAPAPGGG